MGKLQTMDGNNAAAYISYPFTEVVTMYPITPSSPMAEYIDEWSSRGKKNLFGKEVKVVEMQSEAGAAGAMHGSLAVGALTTTYTASQGLLLMIPNLYKMAGELLPGVLHVSARAVATHALSIFGDHQDVMACRAAGCILIASSNVQEAMDMGCIAHLSSISSRLPSIHFFDGFRTSHEMQKISTIEPEEIIQMIDMEAVRQFRERGLNPEHPVARGTAQNPDIYFQGREVQNPFYDKAADIVAGHMKKLGEVTGRQYKPFQYYGAENPDHVIIAMGSACDTIDEVVDHLNGKGENVGSVRVHLYRPFSVKHLLAAIPRSTKAIAVLDRTKEPGSIGEPLYLDVVKALQDVKKKPVIVAGRYGLGSKDTRPSQIIAVYNNLKSAAPKEHFTIGIQDDVTHLSLPEVEDVETTAAGTLSCKFWGLGSDGTVGANKNAVKIIGDNTPLYVQGYFSYDSKKSGGTTVSHLRFGPKPIRSPYLVYHADYIACHNPSFICNYDILRGLKKNGIFVLNAPWSAAELEEKLPAYMKRYIAANSIRFYTIDAIKLARDIGLGNRINMVMQSAFFSLINVIPLEEAVTLLEKAIVKTYGKKGEDIVEKNKKAVRAGIDNLIQVTVPPEWANAQDAPPEQGNVPDFVRRIQTKMARLEGDELAVSEFTGMEDGSYPLGTTAYEKRGIAVMIPQWQPEKCIQCGFCSYICPHATIRSFLLNDEEKAKAPADYAVLKPAGKGFEGLHYRIQVSPLDCTGCGNCADVCPAEGKALVMMNAEQEIAEQADNWEFATTLTVKKDQVKKETIKGSQFARPLLEFNGACPGCGETPYIRLITQLFGERMVIANATGCSSIWGASAPSIAYSTTAEGKGPAWANSLFEDNAEYGYGMYLGIKQIREELHEAMKKAKEQDIDQGMRDAFTEWMENTEDAAESERAGNKIKGLLNGYTGTNEYLNFISQHTDYLTKKSVWVFGGDGWAYDIGYGGLDHVLATGDDVNLFVMDTEVYSNTGGQASKATPLSAVAKFAAAGKKTNKKDLGMMAMSYRDVYVAQISMGANMNQTLKAINEAESYRGTSLIIAYASCVNHGIKKGMGVSIAEQRKAVESGYWHLYRFDPRLRAEGKNPFQMDSKEPKTPYKDFLKGEIRYAQLANTFPEAAETLFDLSEKFAKEKYETFKQMAERSLFLIDN